MSRRIAAFIFLILAVPLAAADNKPEPTDDKLLFEGPVPGEAVIVRPLATQATKVVGDVMFVARDAVYFRTAGSANVDVYDVVRFKVKYVAGKKDGKALLWEYDEAKKEMTGVTAPLLTPEMPAAGVAPPSEAKYLFFALQRLQDRIDQAVAGKDKELLKHLGDRADIVRMHAEKNNVDRRVVKLYGDLADYIQSLEGMEKRRAEFLDVHMDKVEQNKIKDQEAALRAEMVKTRGLGEYFRGAFPRISVSIGRGYWGRPYGYATSSVDYGGAMAGVATIIRGQQQYELQRLQIAYAKRLLDKDKEKTISSMESQADKYKEDRQKQIAAVGAEAFGLPNAKDSLDSRELAKDLNTKGDYKSLTDVLEKLADAESKSDKQVNPFTQLEIFQAESHIKAKSKPEQGERLFGMAVRTVEALKYIPPGKVYDPDRADLMRAAAGLACMAAMLDSPNDTWGSAYSVKAAYAVRLLDRAQGLILDQSGQVREQQAVANALAGRPATALALMEEIKGTRKNAVAFLLSYVRLLALNEQYKDGLNALEDAINQGYNDVGFIDKNLDFNHLKKNGLRYTTYTKPQFSAVWVVPKAIQGRVQASRIEILNNSPFTITDARVTLKVEVPGGRPAVTKTVQFSELGKNETYVWEEAFNEPRVNRVMIYINADQGKTGEIFPVRK